MNRRDHATGAATAELNRWEFKRHEARVSAQFFALLCT
jgi:hypothetical protein